MLPACPPFPPPPEPQEGAGAGPGGRQSPRPGSPRAEGRCQNQQEFSSPFPGMRCPTCPAAHGDASEVKDKNKPTSPKSASLLEPGIEAGFPSPPRRCQSPALLDLRVVRPTCSTSMPVPHTPKKTQKRGENGLKQHLGFGTVSPRTLCAQGRHPCPPRWWLRAAPANSLGRQRKEI